MDIMVHKRGGVILDVTFTNLRSNWKKRIPDGSKLTDLVRTQPEFIAHLITKADLPIEIREIAIKMYKQVTPASPEEDSYRKSLIEPNIKEETC